MIARRNFVIMMLVVTLGVFSSIVASFASDYPTPTASPDPFATPTPSPQIIWYNEQTPPPVSSVSAAVSFYFIKYMNSTTYTSNYYYTTDGVYTSAGSSYNYRLSGYVPCDGAKTITAYNTISGSFVYMRSITFFDVDKNVILGHNFDSYSNPSTAYTNIPENAAFVRVSVSSSYSGTAAANRFRIGTAPEVVSTSDSFWRSEFQPNSFYQTEDGSVILTVTAPDFACDEVFLDVRFGNSYVPAHNFSGKFSFNVLNGGTGDVAYPLEYNDPREHSDPVYPYLYTYFINSSGDRLYSDYYSSGTSMPFFANSHISNDYFSGFILSVPLYKPTGLLANSIITFSMQNLMLDDKSVVIAADSDSAISDLDQLGDDLAVVPPSPGVIFENINNLTLQLNDSNFNSLDWFGPSNGILMTMCITVFCLAALGYILYGKRG